jgi:hypothetical protein
MYTVGPGYGEKTEKLGKLDTQTLWHETWRETLKNVKNETQTMYDLEYGENTDQQEKSETYMVGHVIWRKTLKNVKNKNYTL